MSKHTPGPWQTSTRTKPRGGLTVFSTVNGVADALIAQVSEGESYEDRAIQVTESDANACLIAAAPDLLEACKTAVDFIDQFVVDADAGAQDPDAQAAHAELIAAIAKARGGTQ